MSETTNLKLFKHDNPSTNENQFDIEEALNENWDKIDTAYGNLNTNKVDKEEGKGLSTNDFTNELKTKLDSLENYNDTEIKKDISDIQKKDEEQDTEIENLKSENTELKAENERLRKDIDNNIPTISGNGENVSLEDTTDSRFTKFEVTGNSKQETSSEGNNILNLNKPYLKDKVYKNNGVEENYDGANTYSLKLETGVKYYISITEGGSYYTKWKNNTFVSYEIKTVGVVEETRNDSFDEIRYSLFTSASNFETSYINKNTNTGYEEFTPNMPSTEYISKIHNVGDNINLFNVEGTNFNNSGKNNFTEKMAIGDTSVGQSIYNDYTNNIRCRAYYKVLTNETVSISFNNNYTITYFLEANTSGVIEKTSYNKETNFEYTATKDTILCLIFSKKDSTEFSNSDVEILKSSIKIEKGDKATTYSKYGQGNANITVCNRNMLNLKENSSVTLKGLTCSIDESGVVTLNGKIQKGYVWFKLTNELKAYESETPLQNLQEKIGKVNNFTISAKKNSGTSSDSVFPKICLFEKNGARLGWETIENSTIKGTNLEEYTSISIYAGSTETEYNNFKFKVQLEEGQNVTEYIEHQEQNFIFPLQEGQKLRLTDKLADDGIHHKRKQVVITEDMLIQEIVTTYTNLDYIRIKKPTDFAGYNNSKANISLTSFAKEFTDWTFDSTNYIDKYTCRLQYTYFMLGIAKGTTYAEIKDKLIGQTIEYDLTEEEIDEYTEEQQAVYNEIKKTVHSYKDVTHIFSTDETSAIFNVEAKRDIQTQNDNLQLQINEIKELLSTTATSALLLNNMQSDLESEVE